MMKNMTLRLTLAAALIGAAGMLGCAENNATAPAEQIATTQAHQLDGSWSYQSTDGYDLSQNGISYTFANDRWTYQLGEAGVKEYSIATTGDQFTAALEKTTFENGEAIGSQVQGRYRIANDSLIMSYGGHTAVLLRMKN